MLLLAPFGRSAAIIHARTKKKKVQDCDYVFGSSTKFQRRMNEFVKADICPQVSVCLHVFLPLVRSLQSAVYVLLWPVTKNIEMSLLFILFVGAIPFLWILSPIDVTLYFNSLGIFDYISRACWSKSMCGQRMVDVLHWWIIKLTTWALRSANKQRREISHLEYVFSSRQVRGNRLLIHGELYHRTLKQDILKQRLSSLASKNICVDCLAIVRLVN